MITGVDRDLCAGVHRLEDAGGEVLAGSKAATLGRLICLGVPVPTGVVITSAVFDRFLDATGLRATIARCEVQGDAAAIRGHIAAAAPTSELSAVISRVHAELAGAMLAVRSSALGEDGETTSFAGQLDSVLGVETAASLAAAVRTVWASCWSDRATFYRTARHATITGVGVIVQRQVPAVAAGVLFTRDPQARAGTSAPGMMVEYGEGLADGLVTGQVDPARLSIDRTDFAVRRLAELDDAASHRVHRVLTPARITELASLALRIEESLGAPQDIEWAIDRDGRIWIVQARPITTLGRPGRVSFDETRHATPAVVVWSNANVSENFPEPISPLLYSIASLGYSHYFRNLALAFGLSRRRVAAMERPLRGIIGVHGARMYYHLTNIHATLRMAPFGDLLTRAFNTFVGVTETAAQPGGAVSWQEPRSRVSQALEVVRIAIQTTWQFARLGRRVSSFERVADAFAADTRPSDLAGRDLGGLLGNLHGFLDIRCHRWKNASLADAAAMVSYALLERSLTKAHAAPGTHNRLLRALPNVPSSTPPLRLWDLSRLLRANPALLNLIRTASADAVLARVETDDAFREFRADLARYLEEWGFRSSSELMLTVPSLTERPAPVIDLLKRYAESTDEAPADIMARQATARAAETSRILRSLLWRAPWRIPFLWRLIAWTQHAVAYRERARLKQALLYSRCRQIALHIGDRLVARRLLRHRDDIFMLTCQEIDELASGRAMFPYHVAALVERRRAEHAELAAMQPPDSMRLAESEYLAPGAEGGTPEPAPARATAGTTLTGVSACGGRVTAPAAVLDDVSESNRLTHGDILVTRQTDPGWAPVFCLISGLVIERGGMLSHGAIIAREFGLPCIVGVKDATARIGHGTRVTIDGDRGVCTVEGGAR